MELYFVTATYTNNVYKLDDFFTGSTYKQVATKKLDLNFKADDGVTSIITPLVTPDSVNIRTYTHVIVPSQEKIYKIISADYHNTNQYFLTLDDDPLIANYQTLKDKNIILNRTNDNSKFIGVNDISNIVTKKSVSMKLGQTFNPQIKVGTFALLLFQGDVSNISLEFSFNNQPTNSYYKKVANTTELIDTYPEVETYQPDSIEYFEKTIWVESTTTAYQCVCIPSTNGVRLRWTKLFTYTVTWSDDIAWTAFRFKPNASDINVRAIVLPIRRDLVMGATELRVPSFLDLTTIGGTTSLLDIKIVNDLFFNIKDVVGTYDPVNRITETSFNGFYLASSNDYIALIANDFKDSITLSRPSITSIYSEYPPFKKHYIQVFGLRYEISPQYFDKLGMYFNLSAGVINYIIYYNNKENIIASGSFTHQAKWFADQLDRFYELNPTYKEQFFIKMGADAMKTIAGGAIAGSVVPGIGTAAGAITGTVAATLDAGLSMINLQLQEKSLSLQPDQINGNNSDLPLQLEYLFGIFWIEESVITGVDEMKIEYGLRGFPTSKRVTISSLTAQNSDAINLSCKIVYGELKEVVKNNYVTGYINNLLKNGVIFI